LSGLGLERIARLHKVERVQRQEDLEHDEKHAVSGSLSFAMSA
jgi:hypothetical protein